jgi:hypothetical protein
VLCVWFLFACGCTSSQRNEVRPEISDEALSQAAKVYEAVSAAEEEYQRLLLGCVRGADWPSAS